MTQDEIYDAFWSSDVETESKKFEEAAEQMDMQTLLENYVSIKQSLFACEVTKLHYEFLKRPKNEAIAEIIEAKKAFDNIFNELHQKDYDVLEQVNQFSAQRIYVGEELTTYESEEKQYRLDEKQFSMLREMLKVKDTQISEQLQILKNLVEKRN